MNFKEKVVWITGASSGIGRQLAISLADQGARLILSARQIAVLEELRAQLTNPEKHRLLAFDLASGFDVESTVDQAWTFDQGIDVLVNNAGISQRSMALETCLDVDRRIMEIDYFAPIALTKSLVPRMIGRGQGTIINVASLTGKIGVPKRSAYCAAKHALIGFMDSLRAEIADTGIRIVNVCPGFVNTNIANNALTGNLQKFGRKDHEIASAMSAEKFVEIMIKKLNSSNSEIIVAKGKPNLGYWFHRLLPNVYHRLLPRIYRRKDE